MSRDFIAGLESRPDFGRIFICSPWINLGSQQLDQIERAFARAKARERQTVKLYIITRPARGTTEPPAGVGPLMRLGARIVLKPNVHTKLYIREPGPNGGLQVAVIGSENLTRSRYLELGLRIQNDSTLVDQLTRYFFDLAAFPETE